MSAESNSPDWADILAKEWLELIRGIYTNRKTPNNGVSDGIVSATGKELSRVVNEAFGQTIDYNAVDIIPREILKKNIWKFSVAKNYNDCIRLSNLLIDKDGKIKKWNDFKRDALRVVGESNRYLKTEYDTVVAGAMMSRKWHDIQRDKEIFPFVKFQVVSDGRTSDICKPLHEVVVRADDPFLEYYFPPNHFNCRTDVIKLRDAEITPSEELPQVDIPEAFLNNVGESGELFTEENPYIKNTPRLFFKDLEYYKKDGILISTLGKKKTSSENELIRIEKEFNNRLISAKALKKHFNTEVKILPEIKPSHWAYDYHFEGIPHYGKVPDLKVGDDFWEAESYEGDWKIRRIGDMIKHGQEQADNLVLLLKHKIGKSYIEKRLLALYNDKNYPLKAKEIIFVDLESKEIIYHYKK